VRSPRRLVAITIRVSALSYLMIGEQWLAVLACMLLVMAGTIAALLLLPAVWSRKKFRRDAASGLAKLIIGSQRS